MYIVVMRIVDFSKEIDRKRYGFRKSRSWNFFFVYDMFFLHGYTVGLQNVFMWG